MFFKSKAQIPTSAQLRVDGRMVSVNVRIHPRARSYRLSIPHTGVPLLTLPPHGHWAEAEAFLLRHDNWLASRLKRTQAGVNMGDGGIVPVRGVDHAIIGTGKIRGHVALRQDNGVLALLVPGDPAHQARRLMDWLKGEAAIDLAARTAVHAKNLGVTVKAIKLRNQSSRWGSCTSSGHLNYNWRLILAPPYVLDYVAAHEVAHLREMNHSDRFWAHVKQTLPDMERGRAWLKAHGHDLMLYGI